MVISIQDYIRIVLPDPIHNNYGIECLLADHEQAKQFEILCLRRFPSSIFGTFWQGGHDNREWRYFEFWNGLAHQYEILSIGEEIANQLGHELAFEVP